MESGFNECSLFEKHENKEATFFELTGGFLGPNAAC